MATTEVILIRPVAKLGAVGDVRKVRRGYARNWLLPFGYALAATDENMDFFDTRRENYEKDEANIVRYSQELQSILRSREIVFIRKTKEDGELYGSVSRKEIVKTLLDIRDVLAEDNPVSDWPKPEVLLPEKIKTLGVHDVEVRPHSGVKFHVKIHVVPSIEDLELEQWGNVIMAEGSELKKDLREIIRQEIKPDMQDMQSGMDGINKEIGEMKKEFTMTASQQREVVENLRLEMNINNETLGADIQRVSASLGADIKKVSSNLELILKHLGIGS